MLVNKGSFDAISDDFEWTIPERYNIGVDICDKWAAVEPERLALIDVSASGEVTRHTFGALRRASNQLALALAQDGVSRGAGNVGDRVGVLLPQCVETALVHIAVTKMGCISIPLFTLFARDALLHRLRDSGAKVVVTNRKGAAKLAEIRSELPDLEVIYSIDGAAAGAVDFHARCAAQSEEFAPVDTSSEDPALLIYTSGTTGNPKGALHAHRVLLGHLPGVELSHDFLPQRDDLFWTPADWAWIGGLLDVLMTALHHGIPVVGCRFEKFSAEAAFDLMRSQSVRNAFLPPTALKLMKLAPNDTGAGIALRSVGSGGEALGTELIEWGEKTLGATINEFYGQTECNMVISSCAALEPPVPGGMGRAVPGHEVEIIDGETGDVLPAGSEGAIAVSAPDPVMFLRYWNNPEATEEKFVSGPEGTWLLTGDRGTKDADGRFHFLGRDDDVISSAGYRIGPGEIEDCLLKHPAVSLAGVVGQPDAIRGSVVAAYLVLRDGFEPTDALAVEIAQFVKARLAAHEYPRVVRFIDDMPMTTTGKIIRRHLRAWAAEAAEAAE
ncbi:MAG: AMP-binding protein [Pseudomonadota bacterium]